MCLEAELKQVYEFNVTLTHNYQELVGNLRTRDTIVQGQCQGYWACLLFVLQRGSERGERGVVVTDKLTEEVLDEI